MRNTSLRVADIIREHLPNKYVNAFIKNLNDKSILKSEKYRSMLHLLTEAFKWEESNEGEEFWTDVYNAILSGGELPELPFSADWHPNSYVSSEYGNFLINLNNEGIDILITVSPKISNKELPEDIYERIICEKHLAFCN